MKSKRVYIVLPFIMVESAYEAMNCIGKLGLCGRVIEYEGDTLYELEVPDPREPDEANGL